MKSILLTLGVLALVAAGAFAQEQPAPAAFTIDKLPFVCDKPGTYRLAADLSCNDSGILILSNDVVIDLDGHTLTFGAGEKINDKARTYNSLQSGNVGHHAIYVTRDPRDSKDAPVAVGWNNKFTGCIIRNGKIRTGGGKGLAYSDAINVAGTVGCEIRDLVIENAAADSSAIIGGEKCRIHDCTLIDTNTVVSNRHAQLAVIVSGPEAEVYNCTIRGGAQAGIKAFSGSEIHHNDIRHNATATNCYGIQGYGQKDIHAHHNLIIPTNGRGLHISEKSVGWRVHDNYIEPRERANKEYPKGMQTHGIKMENCREAKVYNNVVYGESVPGGSPTPLNLDVPADANNEVYNNVFIAKTVTPKEHASAIYCVAGDGTGTNVHDNIFFTNDRVFECIWDAPKNYTFTNNRFYRLSPTDKITTYYFWNAKPTGGFRFVDNTYGPGVAVDGHDFPVKNPEGWPKDGEYQVEWTMTLTVTSDGKPVPGAKVTAVTTKAAAGDAKVYTADADGKVRIVCRQFSVVFHAKERTVGVADAMPCRVKIDAGDAGSYDFELTLESPSAVDADVRTRKHVVTSRKAEAAPDVLALISAAKAKAGPGK